MTNETRQAVGVARLDLVVLDCPDPARLAAFYARILGWAVVDSDESWVAVRDTSTSTTTRTGLAFQRADDFVPPTWPLNDVPQQSHLDLDVADLDAAESLVLAAGATSTGLPDDGTSGFRVYLDPAGHPFCLCQGS
ncbi:MAG: VOC family protein [Lacisediminihabitans sp.]